MTKDPLNLIIRDDTTYQIWKTFEAATGHKGEGGTALKYADDSQKGFYVC